MYKAQAGKACERLRRILEKREVKIPRNSAMARGLDWITLRQTLNHDLDNMSLDQLHHVKMSINDH
jgi:hypothetical protein